MVYVFSGVDSDGYNPSNLSSNDLIGWDAIQKAERFAANPVLAQDPQLYAMMVQNQQIDVTQLQEATHRLQMQRFATEFVHLPPEEQKVVFSQLDANQRNLLTRHYGVQPSFDGGDGGWMGSVWRTFNNVAEPIVGAVPEPIRAGLKDVTEVTLDGLSWAGDRAGHVFRTLDATLENIGIDIENPAVAALVIAATGGTAAWVYGGLGALGVASVLGVGGTALTSGMLAGLGVSMGASLLAGNPRAFTDAFRETYDGDTYFRKYAVDNAKELLNGDLDALHLAEELAAGVSVQELAATQFAPGTPEYEQAMREISQLQADPAFANAQKELELGKQSFGRFIARSFTWLDPGSAPYNVLSGSVDAAWLIATDPFLIVGSAAKSSRLARRGINKTEDIFERLEVLRNSQEKLGAFGTSGIRSSLRRGGQTGEALTVGEAFENTLDRIAVAFNSENGVADLLQEVPQVIPIVNSLKNKLIEGDQIIQSADDVFKFLQSDAGIAAISSGRVPVRRDWVELPMLTKQGHRKLFSSATAHDAIDFFAAPTSQRSVDDLVIEYGDVWDASLGLSDRITESVTTSWLREKYENGLFLKALLYGSDVQVAGRNLNLNVFSNAARLAQVLTRQVPLSGTVINFEGTLASQNTQDFINIVESVGTLFNLPTSVKRGWVEVLTSNDPVLQRKGIESLYDGIFTASGLKAADPDAINGLLSKLKNHSGRYGVAEDLNVYGGGPHGVLPQADHANAMRIPDFRDLLAVSRKHNYMRQVHGWANPQWLESGMQQIWKPSVLLRLGFIPRAAGEELLNQLFRKPQDFIGGKILRFAADDIRIDPETNRIAGGLLPTGQWYQNRLAKKIRKDPDIERSIAWDDPDVRELIDLGNIYNEMIGPEYRHRLFGNSQISVAEKMYVYATNAVRQQLRATINNPDTALQRPLSWLGVNGTKDLIFTRQLLQIENAQILDNFDEQYLDAAQTLTGLTINRYKPDQIKGALSRDPKTVMAVDDWENIRYMNKMLATPNAAAEQWARQTMSGNASVAELFTSGQLQLNDPDELLQIGQRQQVIIDRDAGWVLGTPGDPYYLQGVHSQVSRAGNGVLEQNLLRTLTRYVNPSVRRKLEESGLNGQTYIQVLRNLQSQYNLLGSDFKLLLANPSNELARLRLIETVKETKPFGFRVYPNNISPNRVNDSFNQARFEEWLDEVLNLGADTRSVIQGALTQRVDDFVDSFEELRFILRQQAEQLLGTAELEPLVRGMVRSRRGPNNEMLAEAIPPGQIRLYAPAVDNNRQYMMYQLNDQQAFQLESLLTEKGLPENVIRRLMRGREFAQQQPPNSPRYPYVSGLRELNKGVGEFTQPFPAILQGLAFSNYEQALRVQKAFNETLDEVLGLDPQSYLDELPFYRNVTTEELNIATSENRLIKRTDASFEQAEAFDIPVETWLSFDQFGNNPIQIIDGEAVEGVTAETLTRMHAEAIERRYAELFYNPDDNELVHEFIGHQLVSADTSFGNTLFSPTHVSEASNAKQIFAMPTYKAVGQDAMWERIKKFGFNHITAAVDSIARQPLYTMEYLRAMRLAEANVKRMRSQSLWGETQELYNKTHNENSRYWLSKKRFKDQPSKPDVKAKPAHIDYAMLREDEFEILDLALKRLGLSAGLPHLPDYTLATNWNKILSTVGDQAKTGDELFAKAHQIMRGVDKHMQTGDLDYVMHLFDISVRNQVKTYGQFTNWLDEAYANKIPVPAHLASMNAETFKMVNRAYKNDASVRAQTQVMATERAFRAAIRFVDDHRLRSQFQQWTGNYIPFHFATEQFIKRWTRAFAESPEGIRRLQLLYHGMKSSGTIMSNPETGEDIFVMPGSAVATDVIARSWSLVSGKDAHLPIAMPLTGELKMSLPGLDGLWKPSPGPVLGLGLGAFKNRFPELAPIVEHDLFPLHTGQIGDRGAYEVLVPASLRRVIAATTMWDPSGSRHVSAGIRAIQYLEANGYGLEEDATYAEKQAFLDRVENWTRILALTEAIYGFIAPAPPSAGDIITGDNALSLDPDNWMANVGLNADELNEIPRARLFELTDQGFEWDEAVSQFLKENPDATAWTVFASSSVTGVSGIPTEQSLDWMRSNEDLLNRYAFAGSWLIPLGQKENDDQFDFAAYNKMLAHNLRSKNELTEFYDTLQFNAAIGPYQDLRRIHTRNLEAIRQMNPGPEKTRLRLEENDRWRRQSQEFLAANPAFAANWSSGKGEQRRTQVLSEWEQYRVDDRFDKDQQFLLLDGLYQLYALYRAQRDALTGRTAEIVKDYRAELDQRMRATMESYVRRNPTTLHFYNSVIEPGLAEVEELQYG